MSTARVLRSATVRQPTDVEIPLTSADFETGRQVVIDGYFASAIPATLGDSRKGVLVFIGGVDIDFYVGKRT